MVARTVILFALFAAVYSDNVDLFHGTLQSQSPSLLRPTKDTRVPESATPINLAPANEGEFLDGKEYVPYRASRHDEFDWALTKNVLYRNKENTITSPFLVKLLLSILAEAAGTGTSTHRELLSVLPSIKTTNETRDLYGKAFHSFLQKSDDYELNVGTRLFVDKFVEPRQRFSAIVQAFYYSKLETVDFGSKDTVDLINNWCSDVTKNHIREIVTQSDIDKAVILLVNAIFFNGYWKQPFRQNETVAQAFHVDTKNQVSVPFMKQTDTFYFLESDELDAKILRLPYKGKKFAMYVIVPYKVDGLNDLISKIDSSSLHRAQYILEQAEVQVAIPKFKFENSIKLNDVLQELGIREMFSNEASLPLLARGADVQDRLQVTNVVQKTGIDVNEKGSTVYAATQISLTNKFGGESEFVADRPFLFLIEDESTGTLVFSGKVVKPEY